MNQNNTQINIDALTPPMMAEKAEEVGISKANMNFWTLLTLSILAGAFIALGAVFCTTVTSGASGNIFFGLSKLLGGLAFCLGLILVIVAGAELFTGNNLIIMAFFSGNVTVRQLLRNWIIVYIGNFLGSILIAAIIIMCKRYEFCHGIIWLNALNIAHAKCGNPFLDMVARGIMCNALVCLAVWLCFGARSISDKILAIIFPITAFVAAGFEHCVANMYFIPVALFAKAQAPQCFWSYCGKTAADYPNLTWEQFFLTNLIPVTLGNIIGGVFLVGIFYWVAYRREGGFHIKF